MNRWVGRVALVTGASSGIGASVCREILKHGMTVIGCSRSVDKIEAIAKENDVSKYSGKLHAMKCDMSVESEILAMHEEIKRKFGRIDVCINNALSLKNSSLTGGETSDWKYQLDLGILGVCINTRESIKLMKEAGINDGHIIHMGSIVGHKLPSFQKPPENVPTPWFPMYNGMKWMLRALAESLRQEIRSMNMEIKVSTISPGAVETNLMAGGIDKKTAEMFFQYYKVMQPKDVADAVVYVLSTPPHVNVHDLLMEPLAFQI